MNNPIIAGFNPDPSICRSGDDFYVATSSFQWWPGVPIYHSVDLQSWNLCCYALVDVGHLDMRRIGDSAGIWAPCLSFADGQYWLVFTVASGSRLNLYEARNYLTTATNIRGPWSTPVYLNTSGNDPSLFHDDDGRKWLVNTHQLKTPGERGQAGTLLQEYSVAEERLIGDVRNIFPGTGLFAPEGSKIHKHDDWYYLITAEGGTEYGHQATMTRSKNIWGPYEVHPENPILTAVGDDHNPIQRAGHVDIVEVDNNQVAVVYLASRPVDKRSLLGRETFLARAHWHPDGWLRLDSRTPQLTLPDFGLPTANLSTSVAQTRYHEDFDAPELPQTWNCLRVPIGERVDLKSRPGWLTLRPTPSAPDSFELPSIIAQRTRHHQFAAETMVEFSPHELDQWAGLICYYDTRHWYFLARAFDDTAGPCVMLIAKYRDIGQFEEIARAPLLDNPSLCRLGVQCDARAFSFRFAIGAAGDWIPIGEPQDALVLTDEFVETRSELDPVPGFGFTGSFVGLAAYDITERVRSPAFDWFEYRGEETWPEFLG